MWITELLYCLSIDLVKISYLCFCLRIFPHHEIKKWLYSLIILVSVHGIAFTLAATFQCTPVRHMWQNWDGEHTGKCINAHAVAWVQAGTTIALDLAMLGVPIPPLLKLQMSMRKKIYVILMFSIGVLYVKSLLNLF